MDRLLIKNGRVICPVTRRDEPSDVWIEHGKVVRLELAASSSTGPAAGAGYEVFDAEGLIVGPGLIDLHVHLREPGREDCETIESGCAAAAVGGFTAVCAMPNTQPVNDNASTTRWIVQRARDLGRVRVFSIAAVSRGSAGKELTDFEELMEAGAVAFSDDGKPVKTESLMRQALQQAKRLNTFISDHCEDLALTASGVVNAGAVSERLGVRGLPREAEDSMVARDIRLAEETGGHAHVAHLSTAGAVEMVRQAKRRGVNVTCEVAPHHFSLQEETVLSHGANAKMKPPLRTREDVAALVEGLTDGTVDAIATDHAPHSAAEKGRGLEEAPFGIIGLETALPLTVEALLLKAKSDWWRVFELLSANPARLLGRKDLGRVEVGAAADLVLIDPSQEWVFRAEETRSKSRNTPFDGWKFKSRAVGTVVAGEWVHRSMNIHLQPPK